MVADLLPRVERSHLWFSENVELLFCAQIAHPYHQSERSPSIDHLPFDVEGGAPGLPDVCAQFGLGLLVGIGKGAFVARISSLPRGSINVQTCNLLNVLHKQNCERFKIYSSNTPKLQHFMLKCRIRGVFLTSENCSSFKLLLLSIFFSNSQNSYPYYWCCEILPERHNFYY